MEVEIGLPSINEIPERVDELKLLFENHNEKATKQINMSKKAEEDRPKRKNCASGRRTICTDTNDLSFFGFNCY